MTADRWNEAGGGKVRSSRSSASMVRSGIHGHLVVVGEGHRVISMRYGGAPVLLTEAPVTPPRFSDAQLRWEVPHPDFRACWPTRMRKVQGNGVVSSSGESMVSRPG